MRSIISIERVGHALGPLPAGARAFYVAFGLCSSKMLPCSTRRIHVSRLKDPVYCYVC